MAKTWSSIIEEYGAENTGLFGSSAGGGLVLATLLRLKADGLPLPAASAPLSPPATRFPNDVITYLPLALAG